MINGFLLLFVHVEPPEAPDAAEPSRTFQSPRLFTQAAQGPPFKAYFDGQTPYRDRQVLTETGQRPKTETTTKPVRKTETVERDREGLT